MITVSDDVVDVDARLARGWLACPGCEAALRAWGWARSRKVRCGIEGAWREVRPRRARCVGCGATHVLLGVSFAARRADAAEVIGWAVEKKALGWGHRRIAVWAGRPASTVRGWLRAFMSAASAITAWFTARVVQVAVDAAAIWPAAVTDRAGGAISALEAYASGLGQRFGRLGTVAWVRAGIAASGGWLFCAGFWGGGTQHELALPGREGWAEG